MHDWMRHARWHHNLFDLQEVAAVLDTTPEAVQQACTDGLMPEPDDLQYGPRWTEHQVFTTLLAHRPHLSHRVPRLFPTDQGRLSPATFVKAETVEITNGGHGACGLFVAHHWLPSDGRGVVAIAYPSSYVNTVRPEEAADLLHKELSVSAVIVPSGMRGRLPCAPPGQHQPVIGVADNTETVIGHGRWHWFDLAALLRVDLPWWPTGLTNLQEIERWRPNLPIVSIRPETYGLSSTWLSRAAQSTADPDSAAALRAIATFIDREIADSCGLMPGGTDHGVFEYPGLRKAAAAAIAPAITYSPADVSHALHCVVDDPAVRRWAARTGHIYDAFLPVVGPHVLIINRDELSRLGHEWCNRLIPVPANRRNELGFALLQHVLSNHDAHPSQWWNDPLNPDMWAITDSNGIMYATIGTRVPAVGHLTEVAAGHELANSRFEQVVFFRDSDNTAWPVPTTRNCHYIPGVGHQHSERFARTLVALCDDAAADTGCLRTDVEGTELERYLAATAAPLQLTRRDIEMMR